jgi:hypothetical protein
MKIKVTVGKGRVEEKESDQLSMLELIKHLFLHVENRGPAEETLKIISAILARRHDFQDVHFSFVLSLGANAAYLFSGPSTEQAELKNFLTTCAIGYLKTAAHVEAMNKDAILALMKLAPNLVTPEMKEKMRAPTGAPRLTKAETLSLEATARGRTARQEIHHVLARVQFFCEKVLSSKGLGKAVLEAATDILKRVRHTLEQVAKVGDEKLASAFDAVEIHRSLLRDLTQLVVALRHDPVFNTTFLGMEEAPSEWLDPEWKTTREKVTIALLPLSQCVLAFSPGCVLKYRGSLTDTARNSAKSSSLAQFSEALQACRVPLVLNCMNTLSQEITQQCSAGVINLKNFDVDAFIEVPDVLWGRWVELKLIPGLGISKGKVSLSDVLIYLQFYKKTLQELDALKISQERGLAALNLIKRIELVLAAVTQAQARLSHIEGYKRDVKGGIDFSLIIQPASSSADQRQRGKPYPLNQLSGPLGIYRAREILLPQARLANKNIAALLPDAPVTVHYHPAGPPRRGRANSLPNLPSHITPIKPLSFSHLKPKPKPPSLLTLGNNHNAPSTIPVLIPLLKPPSLIGSQKPPTKPSSPLIAQKSLAKPYPSVSSPQLSLSPPLAHALPVQYHFLPPVQPPPIVVGTLIIFTAPNGLVTRMRVSAVQQERGTSFYAREEQWDPSTQYWVCCKYSDFGKTWKLG